jgi:hypothetical protein
VHNVFICTILFKKPVKYNPKEPKMHRLLEKVGCIKYLSISVTMVRKVFGMGKYFLDLGKI